MVGRMKMGGDEQFGWFPYNHPNNSIRHNRNLLYGFYYAVGTIHHDIGSIGRWSQVRYIPPVLSYSADTGMLTITPGYAYMARADGSYVTGWEAYYTPTAVYLIK